MIFSGFWSVKRNTIVGVWYFANFTNSIKSLSLDCGFSTSQLNINRSISLMSKLPQVKVRDLVKIALHLGFQFRDQSGSHAVYVHSDGRKTTIPIHPLVSSRLFFQEIMDSFNKITKILKSHCSRICQNWQTNLSVPVD